MDGFSKVFKEIIYSTVEKHSSVNTARYNSSGGLYKKRRKIIARKLRKLKKRSVKWKSEGCELNKIKKLDEQIICLQDAQKQSYFDERKQKEVKTISKIKIDSRYFFKYANSFRRTLLSPSIIIDTSNMLITDPKEIANSLQNQFKSVFSTPNPSLNPCGHIPSPTINKPLQDLHITTQDIIKANDELKSFSASPKR